MTTRKRPLRPGLPKADTITVTVPMTEERKVPTGSKWSPMTSLLAAAGRAKTSPEEPAPSDKQGVYLLFRGDDPKSPIYISRGSTSSQSLRERLGTHATQARRMCGKSTDFYAQWLVTPAVDAKAWEKAHKRGKHDYSELGSGFDRELELAQEAAEFFYELVSELASTGGADPFSRPALR